MIFSLNSSQADYKFNQFQSKYFWLRHETFARAPEFKDSANNLGLCKTFVACKPFTGLKLIKHANFSHFRMSNVHQPQTYTTDADANLWLANLPLRLLIRAKQDFWVI
jgi:hypothetical protein